MNRQTDWTEYGADYKLGNNPIHSCHVVWKELSSHLWQSWMLFKSGFMAAFRQTFLGFFWGILMPLVPLIAFFILTLLRVFPTHEAIPPLSYMAVGVTLWLYLQGLIVAPAEAVAKHAPVLKGSGFPMICVFMASYGQLAFEMLVRVFVVVPLLLVFFDISATGLGMIPFLLIPASAFSIALGIMLGLAGIVIPDLKNVVAIVLRYLIFISFAVFPLSLTGIGGWLYSLNPLAIFIDNIRSVLVLGNLSMPGHFYAASAVSLAMLLVALHLYNVLERRVAGAL
ncbi:MAG: hypothetical protein ABW168_16845 [Sedimenticola sp.]